MTEHFDSIQTTCPYCGVGCGMLVSRDGDGWAVRGDPTHPANLGRLCSKGAALAETLSLDDRLLHPAIDGAQASWDAALDAVARRFGRVIAEHGPDAVAFYVSGQLLTEDYYVSGQLLTEDYYVANKLMKGYIGAGNIDTNSRLCMSSAVAGHKRAFGADAVPGCYEDLELADLVTLVGSNTAWAHPVVFQRIAAAKAARPDLKVVVIDPRRTATCDIADLHLAIQPGSDAWLFNGLLNHLRREDGIDWSYLENHMEGFGAALEEVGGLDIPRVAEKRGLPEADVAAFYRLFTQTLKSVTVFSQGINQSASGVDKVNSILNVHLATGRVGLPGASPFSITGQLAGMDAAAYDAMAPVQWPVRQSGHGTPRLFSQGHYPTASGRARMIARMPRGPARATSAAQPFVFNTGRVRDQWHTMSRTGKTPRLLAHIAEPYVEMHPADAAHANVTAGGLARVRNGRGEVLARVVVSADQRPGSVFAPIHWNGQNAARARVDALVYAVTDEISGQPEFKHAPVAVEPYATGWYGFVLARERVDCRAAGYWTQVRARDCWRHELAGAEAVCLWPRFLRERFGAAGDWIELQDGAENRYRTALMRDGRVEVVAFFDRDFAALPPRLWLETLFEKDALSRAERASLLLGRPGTAAPEVGRIVCACFGVGEATLGQAIAQGAASVEALGIRLKAGTHCGSCIPELKQLLAAGGRA